MVGGGGAPARALGACSQVKRQGKNVPPETKERDGPGRWARRGGRVGRRTYPLEVLAARRVEGPPEGHVARGPDVGVGAVEGADRDGARGGREARAEGLEVGQAAVEDPLPVEAEGPTRDGRRRARGHQHLPKSQSGSVLYF